MVACDICKKEFKRKDNMLRHKKTVHANEGVGREKHTKEVVSDDSSTEESDMETDMDEKEEKTIDPWFDLVQHTFNTLFPTACTYFVFFLTR